MEDKQNYIRDLTEIRSMMERSSKFLSLSGWAGIMAGIYALAGAYAAYSFLNFNPIKIVDPGNVSFNKVIILAILVLFFALITAIVLSWKKSNNRGEKIWNYTTRQLLFQMSVPLVSGGILILILISKNLVGLIVPLTLLFYGLALYNAGKFTTYEVKLLGISEIMLGLINSYFIEYGLLFWTLGFGVAHIFYGIYMYIRYER